MPVSAAHVPLDTAKTWAKRLARTSKTLTPQTAWPLSRCQMAVAQMLGYEHWHALNQALAAPTPTLTASKSPKSRLQWRDFWKQCMDIEGCETIFIKAANAKECSISVKVHGQMLAYLNTNPETVVIGLSHIMPTKIGENLRKRLTDSQGIITADVFAGTVLLELEVLGKDGTAPRLQFLPTYPQGWEIVIRVRAHLAQPRGLPSFGLPLQISRALERLTIRHTGAFLFTGTAGSGKSSLMASVVENATAPTDPLEHRIPHAGSIPVIRPKIPQPNPCLQPGCAVVESPSYPSEKFVAHAVRVRAEPRPHGGQIQQALGIAEAMRLSPDVLVIGEVRDVPTAKGLALAVEAGITVFTTFHASQGLVLDRLAELAPDKNWSALVKGWAYCRLLPVLCQECARDTPVGRRKGPGCNACKHQGYTGRQMVLDLWEVQAGKPIRLFDLLTQTRALIEAGRVGQQEAEDLVGPIT